MEDTIVKCDECKNGIEGKTWDVVGYEEGSNDSHYTFCSKKHMYSWIEKHPIETGTNESYGGH